MTYAQLALLTLLFLAAPALAAEPTPASLTGNGAKLVWSQDFGVTPLSLRKASDPASGTWMPNDETWQSPQQGYVDFAAKPCSAAEVDTHVCNMAGGTWDLNPNDSSMQGVTPFSQAGGYLTISAFPTPSRLVPAIEAEMKAQGNAGLAPSFVGGHLAINPSAFPGFTYGYFEFRVAFPNAGPGMFPALWFYSIPGKNPDRPHAEIDLLEFLGRSDVFTTSIYLGRANDNKGVHIGQSPGLIDGKFHSYGMDWTADHIDFYLDQQKLYSAPAWLAAAYRGVSLGPMMDYVVDAKWMTSNPHLRADQTTPNPLRMNVSYLRLYSVKPF